MLVVDFRNEMWDYLRSINEYMTAIFEPYADQCGLTLMQAGILIEVFQHPQHTVGTLGEIVGMTSGNASSICKKLQKQGLLKRIRCIEDERCVNLELTEKGKQTLEKIDEAVLQNFQGIFINKSEAELQLITAGLERLLGILKDMKESSSSPLRSATALTSKTD